MTLAGRISYSIGGLLLGLVAVGVFLPGTTRVQRHVDIDAPAATVFALLNDFRQVNKWSPWLRVDPNALVTFSGPGRGAGAVMTWDGQVVGRGSQVILDSQPYTTIVIRLLLDGRAPATSVFTLSTVGTSSRVDWTLERKSGLNLFSRYLGLLQADIIAVEFEQELASLKALAETLPSADFSDIEIEHLTVESADIAYLRTSSLPEAGAISDALGDAYFRLLNFIDRHNLAEAGAPMSIGAVFDGAALTFNAAIPVRGLPEGSLQDVSDVRIGRSYAGRAIRVRHLGSYRTLGETHDKIAAYLAALGIQQNGESWESYVSDPTRVAEDELVTYVYYPVEQTP